MIFRPRRTIQPKGHDRFAIHLGDQERTVVQAVCQDVVAVLDDDEANPLLRRLFPPGHATDEEIARQYGDMVHDDLLRSRREALDTVARTATDTELDRATLETWMVGINGVRLVLGTRLDVSEDTVPDLTPDDPELPAWAVYELLGALVDAIVQALSETLADS